MMPVIKRLLENKTLLASIVITYTCVLTYVFLMPTTDMPRINLPGGTDKTVHFLSHFILVCLWQFYWFRRNRNRLIFKEGVIVLIGSLLYGTIIEILQAYLTISRTADIFDIFANFIGALAGVFFFQKVKYFFTP